MVNADKELASMKERRGEKAGHKDEGGELAAKQAVKRVPQAMGPRPAAVNARQPTQESEPFGSRIGRPRPPALAETSTDEEPFGSRIGNPAPRVTPTQSSSQEPFGSRIGRSLEQASGADLSQVRIHTDANANTQANSVGARAFATGNDIYFGTGQYDEGSKEGRHLIAHEVAHTIQQAGASGHLAAKLISGEEPTRFSGKREEAEADAFADAFVRGERTPALTRAAPSIARKKKPSESTDENEAPSMEAPVRVEGTRAIVSTKWFFKDGHARRMASSGRVLAPTKTPRILRALRSVYAWFEDEQIEKSAEQIYWLIPKDARKQPTIELPLQPSAFALFGMPPTSKVFWLRSGSDAVVLFHHELLPTGEAPSAKFAIAPSLLQRAAEELKSWTGGELNKSNVAKFINAKWPTKTEPAHRAFGITVSSDWIESLIGEARWKTFQEDSGEDAPETGVRIEGGTRFTDAVGDDDRAYFHSWMEEVGLMIAPTRTGWRAPISESFINALKQLDANPALKEKVLAQFRRDEIPIRELTASDLRSLIHGVEMDEKREAFGLGGKTVRDGDRKPKYNAPVRGAIINRGGLVYRNKEIELAFELHSKLAELAVPSMTVQWVAHRKGDKDGARQEKTFRYLVHRQHPRWTLRFNKTGTYVIHAMVNHDMFEENYFSTEIEVKSQDERQRELDNDAFGHMGKRTAKRRDFDTSWLDEKIGDHEYHEGLAYESVLPRDFKASGFSDMDAFLEAELKRMDAAIEAYEGIDPLIVRMAKRTKSRIQGMRKDVGEDKKEGFIPFEVNGAFLSDQNGVPDKTLKLLGVARQTKAAVAGKRVGPSVIQVKIHDTSFVTERVKYEYSAEAQTFMGALELAFLDLCKSYPKGRVSLMAQQLDNTMLPTGKAKGFQLETGTAWKDMKSELWSPAVQAVVNIAGAAAMVFIPGSMNILLPTLIAYNATDTLDNVAQLKAKGVLTTGKSFDAAVMIGVDFIPYLGRLKIVSRMGKVGLYGLEAIEVGVETLLITRQALDTLEELRTQSISAVGELVEKKNSLSNHLAELQRRNKSDPQIKKVEGQLKTLDTDLDLAITNARKASKKAFDSFLADTTALVVGIGASKAMGDMMPNQREDAFAEGTFKHKKGVKPHYDAETGRVVGDRKQLHDANVEDLRNAQLADLQHRQVEMAKLLDVDPTNVIIKHGGKGRATVKKVGEDYVVTIPKDRPLRNAVDDVWAHRKRQKGAPKKRPEGRLESLTPTYSPRDVVNKMNVIVGRPLATRDEAQEILERLSQGDATAFSSLGMSAPQAFDSQRVEWGLGRLEEGGFIIVRGEPAAVDWSRFPGVEALAHTHPIAKGNRLQETTSGNRVASWGEISRATEVPSIARAAIFPSPSDLAFAASKRLEQHDVLTPFVKQGDQVIRADDAPPTSSRITFSIRGARTVQGKTGEGPLYKATLSADVAGQEFWSGKVWAVVDPGTNGMLFLRRPNTVPKPPSSKSKEPSGQPRTDTSQHVKANEKPLSTAARAGHEPTAESVRTGEVQMELHPEYETSLRAIKASGFEVRQTTGNPHVVVEEIYSPNGELLEVDKAVFLQPGMRFLDLEHELGHVRQLLRFGDTMPPTQRLVRKPANPRTIAKQQDGVISVGKAAILEYHNRLDEFLRLKRRRVSTDLLAEHAKGVAAYRTTRQRKGRRLKKWEQEYFADLPELEEKYRQAGGLELER